MSARTGKLLLVMAIVLLGSLACGGSFSTANIKEAVLSADDAGSRPTEVFTPDQIFYCIVELASAPDDTVIKAVWIATEVEGESPDTTITETEFTTGSGTVTFNLANEFLWPVGQYRVELHLNGELDRSLDFEVR